MRYIIFLLLLQAFAAPTLQAREVSTADTCFPATLQPMRLASGAVFPGPLGKRRLQAIAAQLRTAPYCRMRISTHGHQSVFGQQRSWDKAAAVINYLVEVEGISRDRLHMDFGQPGDRDLVRFALTLEDRPSYIPPPTPCASVISRTPNCPPFSLRLWLEHDRKAGFR
ncbi:MAG: hypothetical protein EOO16_14310 [Chitinophagaceae bacterium]|nr:MAG: hypothetical protein EOO16_14310 [Chitinophagaceae bacterium]